MWHRRLIIRSVCFKETIPCIAHYVVLEASSNECGRTKKTKEQEGKRKVDGDACKGFVLGGLICVIKQFLMDLTSFISLPVYGRLCDNRCRIKRLDSISLWWIW